MCAKDDLIRRKSLLLTSTQTRLAGELATAESVTAKDPNHVDTFGLDFAFSFANILLLIAFIISYRLFADELWNIQQSLLDRATVVLIIILASFYHVSLSTTILACTVEHCCLLSNTALENAAKSRILLACADGRTRQCYLTICAILADYEEQVLLTSVKKNRYCMRYTKHYNFNIYMSLATDTLHLLLKGLVIKMLDFITGLKRFNNKRAFTEAIIQQLIAVVSLLFVSKAPFALHFIRAVCNLYALTHIIQDIRMYGALDSICTRANSEAYYITIKEYILQICLHNSQRTALLAADYATVVKQNCTYSTRVTRPLLFRRLRCEVAANIAISDFIHAAAVFQSSSKRHNDPKHCDEEVLYLILIIIDYTCYDKDRKHMAYIRAFSEVLLFNNNGQIDNTTGMLSVPFKFYNLSTIICLVHLVLRDLPNLITRTTISYYVNNYIDWDEYNCLYSLTFNINLLRTL
ncbi:hypothetical protein HBI71_245500 [Parastagonospora nodorum]|nr:hypothetical protein HBI71_245500 [Parastagonospora nodorum]